MLPRAPLVAEILRALPLATPLPGWTWRRRPRRGAQAPRLDDGPRARRARPLGRLRPPCGRSALDSLSGVARRAAQAARLDDGPRARRARPHFRRRAGTYARGQSPTRRGVGLWPLAIGGNCEVEFASYLLVFAACRAAQGSAKCPKSSAKCPKSSAKCPKSSAKCPRHLRPETREIRFRCAP